MNKFFSKCVSFVLSPLVSFLRKEIQIAVENYDAEKVVAAMWKDSLEAKLVQEIAKVDFFYAIDKACDRYNFESRIEQEFENFDIERKVQDAFDDIDVQDIVSDAANDYDFSSLVNESVDQAVEDYVANCIEWQDLIVDKLAEFNFTEFFEDSTKITADVVAYFKHNLDQDLEDRLGHINERLGTIEMQDQHYAVDIEKKIEKVKTETDNEVASMSEQIQKLGDKIVDMQIASLSSEGSILDELANHREKFNDLPKDYNLINNVIKRLSFIMSTDHHYA